MINHETTELIELERLLKTVYSMTRAVSRDILH